MKLHYVKTITVFVILLLILSTFPPGTSAAYPYPKLIITSVSTRPSNIEAGESFDATLFIKNIGDKPARNVRILINKGSVLSPFSSFKSGNIVYLTLPGNEIKSNEEVSQQIKLGSSATAGAGVNNLYITIEYEDENGQQLNTEQVIGIPLEKPEEKRVYEPKLVISRVQTFPGAVEAGQNVVLTLDVTNFGLEDAKSIKVTVNSVEGSNGLTVFSPVNRSNSVYINYLEDGKSKTESLEFAVSPKAEPKMYNISVNLEYQGIDGREYRTTEVVGVTVTKNGKLSHEEGKPQLSVTSYNLSKSPVGAGENFDLTLEITNFTKFSAQNVKVTMENMGADENTFSTVASGNTVFVNQVDGFSAITKRIKLAISKKAASGRHNIALTIDYQDESGNQYQSKEFIGVPVVNQEENRSITQPKVLIVGTRLTSPKVEAGKLFEIEFHVQNIGGDVAQNIALTLNNVQGEQGLLVFAPVDSSNTLFINRLGPHQTRTVKQKMFAGGEAKSKVYNLVVNVEYQDKEGKALSHQEVIGIPVIQDQSLQIMSFDYPQKIKPGQEFKIYSDFINIGKQPIENLLITFTGNFEVDYPTYYLGKFDVGSSDIYETTARLDKPGVYSGNITFSYTNDYGQQTTIVKPVTIEVEKPPEKPAVSKTKNEGGFWSWIKNFILAIFGLGE
ncbi:COG1361 S-layer family protein [Carboxydocella sp. ULO1]|uniref:COG1361 S-layer family protein n=1 Tax=Carboxydocella sp. ULO1 TaxID=1926599 RepID=UPI0009ADC3B5|nr:hypothetical protein [Carboxydocella sp. ULO1]GAW27895.1 hypothetical protein ULO1_04650 [Carboxydocella sp. ULO1]